MRDASAAPPRKTLLFITPAVAITATLAILAFILGFIVWDAAGRARDALAAERQQAEWTARLARSQMERQLDRLAASLGRLTGPADGLATGLEHLVAADPTIDAALIWDAQGRLIAGTQRGGQNWSDDEAARLFRAAASGGSEIHLALFAPGPGLKPHLILAARWTGLRDQPGARLEAVGIDAARAGELFAVKLPHPDGMLALYRGDGAPLYPAGMEPAAGLPAVLAAIMAHEDAGSMQHVAWSNGVTRIVAFERLPRYDAVVVVGVSEAAANEVFVAGLQRNPAARVFVVVLIATVGIALVRRTRHQRSLLQRIALWEQYAEGNPHAVLITDARRPGNPLIYANPAYEALTGRAAVAALGQPCSVLGSPETDPETRARLDAALASGTPFHGEVAALHADGTRIALQLDLDPVRDEHGRISNHVCRLRDVTDHRRAAEAERAAQTARDWALAELRKALDRVATSEGRFRDFASSASDWFWETDANGQIVWLSENAQSLPGWQLGEVPPLPQLHRRDGSRRDGSGGTAAADFRGERAIVGMGEAAVMLEVSGRPVLAPDGDWQGFRGVVQDITEQERLAAGARRDEQRLAAAVEHLPIGLLVADAEDHVLLCNARYCDLFDVDRPQRGDNWQALSAQVRERLLEQYDVATVAGVLAEWRRLALAGRGSMSLPWLDGRSYRVEERRHEAGDRTVVVVDVTELEESRARLMDAVQNVTSGFAIFDSTGRLVLGNQPFHALVSPHLGPNAPDTMTAHEVFARLAAAGVLRLMQMDGRSASAEEIATRVELATGDPFLMTTPDGRTLQIRLRQSTDGGRVVICSDVSLLRQMDVALRSSEAKFRGLAQASSDGIMIVDPAGEVQFANQEARRLFGYDDDDASFDNIETLVASENRTQAGLLMASIFAERRSRALETGRPLRAIRRNGTSFPVEIALSYYETPDGPLVQATIRDITQRLRAEEAERQHAKMVALGTLAGGIAHDLNNALVPILSLSELLLDSGTASPEDAEMLGTIVTAAERARDLVRNILAFSRRGVRSVTTVDLVAVVAKDLPMLRAVIPASIHLDFQRPTEKLPVRADEINLHQVVVNLVTNAAQAIGSAVGEIHIAVEAVGQDGPAPDAMKGGEARAGGPKHGRHARLTISDTGQGMDEETRQRLFEPFFTTKAVGEGTGLGLAIVHNIVTSHAGTITVDSAPGRGTRFTIWFPLLAATSSGDAGSQAA